MEGWRKCKLELLSTDSNPRRHSDQPERLGITCIEPAVGTCFLLYDDLDLTKDAEAGVLRTNRIVDAKQTATGFDFCTKSGSNYRLTWLS